MELVLLDDSVRISHKGASDNGKTSNQILATGAELYCHQNCHACLDRCINIVISAAAYNLSSTTSRSSPSSTTPARQR
jgi:hypothetical protein